MSGSNLKAGQQEVDGEVFEYPFRVEDFHGEVIRDDLDTIPPFVNQQEIDILASELETRFENGIESGLHEQTLVEVLRKLPDSEYGRDALPAWIVRDSDECEIVTDGGQSEHDVINYSDRRLNAYHDATASWGREAQLIKAAEEFAEVSAALTRRWNQQEDDLLSELADARLMLEQIEQLYHPETVAEAVEDATTDLETRLHEYGQPDQIRADGGETIREAICEELEEAGTSGMDPIILASRIEYTLNETVEVLEAMVEAEEAEYVQQRSYQGRYRLVDTTPEAEL